MKILVVVLLFLLVFAGLAGAVETLSGSVPVLEPNRMFDQPVNADLYMVRPGDKLTATFIGTKLNAIGLTIDPQGRVVHSLLGVIELSDKSLSQATVILQDAIKLKYSVEQIVISIGDVRPVSIYVTGAVAEPGLYRGFTDQRVSEVIAAAGGVLPGGSTRDIVFSHADRHMRVDLDKALYAGERDADLPLYAGGRIYVPGRGGKLVNIVGEVNRPCEIELMEGDDLTVLLRMAGGFTGYADPDNVVHQNARGEIQSTGAPMVSGDIIIVPAHSMDAIAKVVLTGAVKNPGSYELAGGMTLNQLVTKAGGMTEQAAGELTTVFRRTGVDEFGRIDTRRYPLNPAVFGGAEMSTVLLAPDSIHVPYRMGFVEVDGEVVNPGRYVYVAGRSIGDYLDLAGGLLMDNSEIEVAVYGRVSRLTRKQSLDSRVRDGDRLTVTVVQEKR